MRKTLLILLLFTSLASFSQKANNVYLKNLLNKKVSMETIMKHEGPMIVSFWATWCAPCIKELTAINKVYTEWQKTTNVKIIAVSIDDARFFPKVKSFVRSKHWKFDVYTDKNQDLKRAFNVSNIPHIILFDKDKNIVWEHTSYVQGSEKHLYEKIKALTDAK